MKKISIIEYLESIMAFDIYKDEERIEIIKKLAQAIEQLANVLNPQDKKE